MSVPVAWTLSPAPVVDVKSSREESLQAHCPVKDGPMKILPAGLEVRIPTSGATYCLPPFPRCSLRPCASHTGEGSGGGERNKVLVAGVLVAAALAFGNWGGTRAPPKAGKLVSGFLSPLIWPFLNLWLCLAPTLQEPNPLPPHAVPRGRPCRGRPLRPPQTFPSPVPRAS